MKTPIISLLLYIILFVCSGAKALQDVAEGNDTQTIDIEQGSKAKDTELEQSCPDAKVIAPCTCQYDDDHNAIDLDCSAVESEDQLKFIFESEIPYKHFRVFTMFRNKNLTVLESGVFGIVSFEKIELVSNAIVIVESGAFDSSYKSLTNLLLSDNQIRTFPFDDFTRLVQIRYIEIKEDHLSTIPADSFQGLTNLWSIRIGYHQGIFTGAFTNIPNLKNLDIFYTPLSIVQANFLKTGSKTILDIRLGSNEIRFIEPGAFDIVEFAKVDLEDNLVTTLDEATWRPLFEAKGFLKVLNNPLTCGCDIAWLFGENNFLKCLLEYPGFGEYTTCSNGDILKDLDPKIFDDC